MQEVKTKKVKKSALIRIALVAFTIYVVVMLINVQVEINNRKKDISDVNSQITQQQTDNDEMRAAAENDDTDYIEQYARDKLDYAKPGEKIFVDVS